MSETAQLKSSGIWRQLLRYLPGQVLPPVLVVLTIPFLTRYLTEVEYGRYILVLTTVAVFDQFALSWIPNCALRFYHSMKEERSSYVSQLFLSWFFTGCLLAVVLGATWSFLPGRYARLLYISLPIGLLQGGNSIVNAYLRVRDESIKYSLMRGFGTFSRLIPGLMCLVFLNGTLADFLFVWLISYGLLFLFELWFSGMGRYVCLGGIRGSVLLEFVKYGLPLIAAGLCNTAMNSADRYMLSGFRGNVEVALYGVCFQLGMFPIQLLSRTIALVVLPRSVQEYHDNPSQVSRLLEQGLQYTIVFAIPIIAVGIGAGEWLLTRVTKSTYSQAAPALAPVLMGAFILAITQMYRLVFMVHQETSLIARIAGVGAVVSIALNLVLIPVFGYLGSAWAFFVTQLLLLLITVRVANCRESVGFPWWTFFLTFAGSGLLFGLTRWSVLTFG